MSVRIWMTTFAVGIGCVGCAPTVHSTPLNGTFERRPGLQEVAVFSTKAPECPYEELAILRAYAAAILEDVDAALEALKERALSIGADAVVGVRLIHSGGESSRAGYTGTAVRFTDETCLR